MAAYGVVGLRPAARLNSVNSVGSFSNSLTSSKSFNEHGGSPESKSPKPPKPPPSGNGRAWDRFGLGWWSSGGRKGSSPVSLLLILRRRTRQPGHDIDIVLRRFLLDPRDDIRGPGDRSVTLWKRAAQYWMDATIHGKRHVNRWARRITARLDRSNDSALLKLRINHSTRPIGADRSVRSESESPMRRSLKVAVGAGKQCRLRRAGSLPLSLARTRQEDRSDATHDLLALGVAIATKSGRCSQRQVP